MYIRVLRSVVLVLYRSQYRKKRTLYPSIPLGPFYGSPYRRYTSKAKNPREIPIYLYHPTNTNTIHLFSPHTKPPTRQNAALLFHILQIRSLPQPTLQPPHAANIPQPRRPSSIPPSSHHSPTGMRF